MELKLHLKNVFYQFTTAHQFKDFKTFNSGHINDTYLIITDKKPYYVLQKINRNIFKNASVVIDNKIKITRHLINKNKKTLQYITAKSGENYTKDNEGNFWALCYFLENSQTFLRVNSTEIALEAGRITGDFLASLNDFNEILEETLPNFHNMSFRFSQFEDALKKASEERKKEAKFWTDFANSNKEEMLVIDRAISNQEIPLRVTHNDTKVSNILFDVNNKAICLIDLDTVMLGIINFDYGDAIRTICNTTNEDEKDIEKVAFNFNYFKSYTQGFLASIKNTLTKNELTYLAASPKVMTFIMGLRFLTDYLNNDVYYKTDYKNHNLDRAKNQFTLVTKIKESQQKINCFIKNNS